MYRLLTHFGVRLIGGLLAALVLLAALPLLAQDSATRVVTDDEVNAIASKLYCPVCENIPLDACGTAACADWRYEIRLQLEAGKTEQEIIDDFVLRFGDRVVGTPQDPTLRALSLVTPYVAIGVGLIAVVVFLVRRRGAAAPAPQPVGETSHYYDLLQKDLEG